MCSNSVFSWESISASSGIAAVSHPETTITNSPMGSLCEKYSISSDRFPRFVSSKIFVSSRQTQQHLSPKTSFIFCIVSMMRLGDSKNIMVLDWFFRSFNESIFAFSLVGRKPMNINLSVGSPVTLRAAMAEQAPGIGNTSILFCMHQFIRRYPGSETSGVPASDISEYISPGFRTEVIELLNSLCSWQAISGV